MIDVWVLNFKIWLGIGYSVCYRSTRSLHGKSAWLRFCFRNRQHDNIYTTRTTCPMAETKSRTPGLGPSASKPQISTVERA
jgi:hypothetical protein